MPRERYIGQQCTSCHELFNKNDDIVVCPDCGSPYHRECYKNEGKCLNVELHEKGTEWQPEKREPIIHNNVSNTASEITHSPVTENNADDRLENVKPADESSGVASYQEEYTKNICPVCGNQNRPNDDFCLKCGYRLEHTQSHVSGTSVKKNVCPVCRLENRENDVFCVRCGAPLDMEKATSHSSVFGMPVIDPNTFKPESNVDGNTLDEYANYIGRNFFSFLHKFLNFSKNGSKFSINFGALLFPGLYFFYRKMNLVGIIVLLISAVLAVPSSIITLVANGVLTSAVVDNAAFEMISVLTSVLSTVLNIACCVLADWFYYRKAKSDIAKIKSELLDENAKKAAIRQKGGTSWMGVLVAATAVVLLAFVSMFIIMAVLMR